MDELTFLLILAGIGVVLLVAMFTYYKHHKKINDEINSFNHHAHPMDDVLLRNPEHSANDQFDDDLPGSFTASRQDNFNIDDVNLDSFNENDSGFKGTGFKGTSFKSAGFKSTGSASSSITRSDSTKSGYSIPAHTKPDSTKEALPDERELVDGVYVNSIRVISSSSPLTKPEAVQPTNQTPVSPVVEKAVETVQQTSQQSFEQPVQQSLYNSSLQDSLQDSDYNSRPEQKINIVYDTVPDGVNELIISHTILAHGDHFTGNNLYRALENAGLLYGEMNIYHYPGTTDPETYALFSVANVVEPGTFNPQDSANFRTPGISMFMRLPTRTDSYKAYEEFIHVAQMIAAELDGELCDESRSLLTQQAIAYKKEQIRKLNFELAKADKLAGSHH